MKAQCGHDAQAPDDDATYRSTTGRPHRAQTPGHRERAGHPDATDDEETSHSHASREMQTRTRTATSSGSQRRRIT